MTFPLGALPVDFELLVDGAMPFADTAA